LQGSIEVDMSPAELQSHGILKNELNFYVKRIVAERDMGQVFVDRTRLRSDVAGLHCEPDVLYVSWATLRPGRARYLPAPFGEADRLMEVDGAADLAVEVVSRGSVNKDTKRLPPLYARAGVRELWLADARLPELRFQIFHLRDGRYVEAAAGPDGFRRSEVLDRSLRLRRELGPVTGTWRFLVDEA
jgi:Uma2 family endonuclease